MATAGIDTGCASKEPGLIEISSKLLAEAEDLTRYIEGFLLNPPEKDQKECRGIMSTPFSELKANLHDTLFALTKIRGLFNAEVVNKLK